MNRTFVETCQFQRDWAALHLTEDDLESLENQMLTGPEGYVMADTGGMRKFRFALDNRSKSRSCRVIYLDLPHTCRLYLVAAYCKKEKENLNLLEKKRLRMLANALENEKAPSPRLAQR